MTLEKPPRTKLITQGQRFVSNNPNAILATLLGSCVSCCLWDEFAQVGGMNHLLLASKMRQFDDGMRDVGSADMELLINDIIKKGGHRSRLQAKVFGGAEVLLKKTGIGKENAMFVLDYLRQEGIPCISASVGGRHARGLKFWPTSGRVILRFARENNSNLYEPAERKVARGDVEMF